MFSGLKFIPRDQVEKEHDESDDESEKRSKKSGKNKHKDRRKKKSKRYSSSDEDLEKIKKGSKKKKKWYASDEDLSSESESESEYEKKKHGSKKGKKDKGRDTFSSEDEDKVRSKKNKGKNQDITNEHKDDGSLIRKEMGLDWMLRPKDVKENILENQIDEASSIEEVKKVNPRELNPYFKDSGSGYPEEESSGGSKLLISSTIVGDGGASWRLKALKRAKEQAARENRKLDEVVEERWGSVSELAVSVATNRSANTRAHLHAIHNRRKDFNTSSDTGDSVRHKMKVPKVQDSLTWGKRDKKVFDEDSKLVSSAISEINKFNNDGNFMSQFMQPKNDESDSKSDKKMESNLTTVKDVVSIGKVVQLSSNQVAAKVMQLRMKGKHEEAEKLLKEAENLKVEEGVNNESTRTRYDGNTSRIIMHDKSIQDRKREEDGDLNLARRITGNHKYSVSKQADDEYDYEDGPRKKSRKKRDIDNRNPNKTVNFGNNMMRQHEKCQFCFENPTRPKHLVISIANFAYLSLPQWEPVVPGHCCILTMQHESATRSLDDNVWNEIRNFKKCLMMMFGKQEKDVVFIETVMGISQQRHHCLVECIPLPREIAKQAPVYFKKAIDEAEDEWSQHNAKKLIDTSEKGLRGSIPKNFPYFYVEFGLDKGYVHVIDDEKGFKGSFGLNVVRGMLRLSAEDMNRRRKHESVDKQKEAVVNFARDWEPFDWTKQLDS